MGWLRQPRLKLELVLIELKKPGVPARAAFDENLTHYYTSAHQPESQLCASLSAVRANSRPLVRSSPAGFLRPLEQRYHFRAGFQPVQIIRPSLHHLAPL